MTATGRRAGESRCSSTATRPSTIRGVAAQPKHSWTRTASTGRPASPVSAEPAEPTEPAAPAAPPIAAV